MTKIKVAFIYDFDGTLVPGNMQEYSFIPDIGMTREAFWAEVKKIEKANQADNILAYMYFMLDRAKNAHKPVRKADIISSGQGITCFTGVEGWFSRINDYARSKNIELEHYIVSSGIKEIIQGTKISGNFKEIFASSFIYDENGVACWPAQGVNYTSKTQFLFRINKGAFDVTDHSKINKFVLAEERYIPFTNMIYFGDGETDIPCMKLTKVNGGHSIAVFKPNSPKKQTALKLLNDNRVDFALSADYSKDKAIDKTAKLILDKISMDYSLKVLQKKLNS